MVRLLDFRFKACLYSEMVHKKPLKDAKEKAGGPSALARICNVTPQAVDQWQQIPIGHVFTIEKALNLPREYQRPDIYPPQE